MDRSKKILVIEDEQDIQTLLEYNLQQAGYEVVVCENGEDGLWLATEHKPDLILLDWMLPLLSGIEVLRQLRKRSDTREIPVMMLTARGEEGDRLRGLDSGADDYVTKPFSPAELVARITAVLRRHSRGYDGRITGADIELDLDQKRVSRDGTSIHLGPTEFRLLEHFMRNQGRVYSRDQLLDNVWGDDVYVGMRTVDVHIRRLRKAINITGGPDVIRTVRSMGYAFDPKV